MVHGEDKEQRKAAKTRGVRMLEEDAEKMISDHPEAVAEEVKIQQKMRKAVAEEGSSSNKSCDAEVIKDWGGWLEAIGAEVSFLEEKEALKELKKEEVEKMRRKAEAEGRKIEVLPSKIVTVKPGGGGRKKVTWVVSVCGNYEPKREEEDTFSGGAHATAFRIAFVAASRYRMSFD